MTKEPEYVGIALDARAIKVLAHPLRSRLLSRLRTVGSATATELAAELSTNTGATSYHLRKLESVGLVTDTGEGEGKRRLWRASTQYHSWTNAGFRDDEDTATALGWLQRDYVRQFAEKAERWLDAAPSWPAEWVDALGLNDTFVVVTPEQMASLQQRLDELLTEFRTAGAGDDRARKVSVYCYARPSDHTPPEDTEGEHGMRRSTRPVTAAAARRTLLVLSFTRWFPTGLIIGLTTLLVLHRGMSLTEVGLIAATQGFVVLALELPTGGLADALGRRPVLLLGGLIGIASGVLFVSAQTVPAFVLAAALQGVYRALDSGPMEAWYVDAAHAEDATIPVDQALSRAGTVIGLAIALGALTSGGLVAWHPIGSQSPLLLPFWIAIGLNLVHLVGCALLVREPRPEPTHPPRPCGPRCGRRRG